MSEMTIEHAGVHYASHALIDARRELERERLKLAMTDSGIKGDVMTLYPAARTLPGATVQTSATTTTTAQRAPATTQTPVNVQSVDAETTGRTRATEQLDALGQHPPADHTRRVREGTPTPVAQRLRSPPPSPTVAVASLPPAQAKVVPDEVEVTADVTPTPTEEERAAMQIICSNPRLRLEMNRLVQLLREQRVVRERFAALEEFERVAVADVWALEWERLYDEGLRGRQHAAGSERERVARAHWHARVEQRRAEMLADLQQRESEAVLHSEELLRLIDMRSAFKFWLLQIASFDTGLPAIEGPPVAAAIEDVPSA